MASKNGEIPKRLKKVDTVNGTEPGEANVVPVLPNYLTSKLGKDETAAFMDDVSEDGKDHGFGCDSDDDAFEAGLLDAAADDANRSKLKCKVDDDDNDIVADLEKNFVTMELNPLYSGDLKTHNPPDDWTTPPPDMKSNEPLVCISEY